jgi:hypothetical protein
MRYSFTRQIGVWGVTLSLAVFAGCDAIQEIVDDGSSKPATPTAPPVQRTQPQVQPVTPAVQPVQPAVVDPAKILAEFKALQPAAIGDREVAKIADVPEAAAQIVEINAAQGPLTASGIALFVKFPNLKSVKLNGMHAIRGGGFSGLGNVKTLQAIELNATQMNGQDLAAVSALPDLQVLKVNNTGSISAQDYAALKNIKKLSVLDISHTLSGDSVTPILATLPITVLDIQSTQFTDEGLAYVAKIQTLEELNVSFTRVTGDGFKVFRSHDLKLLTAGGTNFGVRGLQAIKGMNNLESLSLYQCGIIGTLKEMNVFGTFPNLKHLNLGKNGVSDLGMKTLFVRCKDLEELNVSHNIGVTNKGLVFLKNHKKLKRLILVGTTCNQQGVAFIKSEIPGIEVRL